MKLIGPLAIAKLLNKEKSFAAWNKDFMNEANKILRLKSILTASDPALGPNTISIHPTNACQLNCITCWHYSPLGHVERSEGWIKQKLPLEKYQQLLNEFAQLQIENIVFSGGGDPLAHPDILEFITGARSKGIQVQMVSNLLLTKDIDKLAASGLSYVVSNCSAGSPEVYAQFHPNQKPDSFHKFENTVTSLVQKGVKIELSCIMCSVNYKDVSNMLNLAARTSKIIRFKNLHLQEAEGLGIEKAMMNETEIEELKKQLPTHIQQADQLGLNHNLKIYEYYLKKDYKGSCNFPIESISCYAPYYNACIRANGNVVVCPYGPIEKQDAGVLGNIFQKSFKEIWSSEEYSQVRKALRERKYFDFCKFCEYYPYFKTNKDLTEFVAMNTKQKS